MILHLSRRRRFRRSDFLLRNIHLHRHIPNLVRPPPLPLRRPNVIPRSFPIPRRAPFLTSREELFLRRVIAPSMLIAETSLALVVTAALHTETTFCARLA